MPLDGTTSEVSECLRRAAEIIEERGWWQGINGIGPKGQVCVLRAINVSAGDRPKTFVKSIIRLETWLNRLGIAKWNDHPDRTKDEVLKALREAAETV